MRSPLAVLLLAFGLLLCGAAVASADVTISRNGSVVTIVGDDGPNAIERPNTLFGNPEPLIFGNKADPAGGAGLVAGPGCLLESLFGGTRTVISCGTNDYGLTVQASLGGGDDYWGWSGTPAVPQTIDGGPGNDELWGDNGDDVIRGGDGNDKIYGRSGDDQLFGDAGDDTILGYGGNDTLDGGPGRDNLHGDSEYTSGNDTIQARDGEIDQVECWLGADKAVVDANDVIASESNCEQLERGAATGPGPAPGPDPGTPGAGPAVTLARPLVPKLGRLLAGRAVSMTTKSTVTCGAVLVIYVPKNEARRLKIGKKETLLGKGKATRLTGGVARKLTAKLSMTMRKKLRRARTIKARVGVVCVDATGRQAAREANVTIRR